MLWIKSAGMKRVHSALWMGSFPFSFTSFSQTIQLLSNVFFFSNRYTYNLFKQQSNLPIGAEIKTNSLL